MEYIESFFALVGDLTWGWALVPMLIIFGLLFTIVGRFAQFTYCLLYTSDAADE